MIVVDASVIVNAIADDGEPGGKARDVLRGEEVCVPDLADIEILSVLRRLLRADKLSAHRCYEAVDDLVAMPAQRYSSQPLIRRIFELRENLSSYDAAYVALAEALKCELVTGDARLASTPDLRCAVRVLS